MASPSTQHITWDTPLTMADVAEKKAGLEAAFDAAPDAVQITVASAEDYLARQLVAAAQQTASAAGIPLTVTCTAGDWNHMKFKENAS